MAQRRSPVPPVSIEVDLHCTVEDQRRLLAASPFFSGLAPAEVRAVQQAFRQRHYQPGEVIQRSGEPATRLSIVAAGIVKMVRRTFDGQEVLLDFLGAGEHFGSLEALGDTAVWEEVTAHTACCILSTTAEQFQDLLERYPAIARAALRIVAGRLRAAQAAIEQLSAHPVERRIAATLLHLADTRGRDRDDGTLIEMPLSRQDIADMTGSTVETASRILSDLRRQGVIDSGRRWVAVRDRSALARLATAADGSGGR
mgnify:CR=1 FL=1